MINTDFVQGFSAKKKSTTDALAEAEKKFMANRGGDYNATLEIEKNRRKSGN